MMHSMLLKVALLLALIAAGKTGVAADADSQLAGVAYLRVGSGSSSPGRFENYCAYADPRLAQNLSRDFDQTADRNVVDVYPDNGCQPSNASYAGGVVIVARGGCPFADKAIRARAQGASGVIVVSSERYVPYLTVDSSLVPGNYPVSMVSKVAYQSMKSRFLSSGRTVASLYRPVESSNGYKQYMFLVLYAIALVTMVISCISAATALKEHLLARARLSASGLNSDLGDNEMDASGASWWQVVLFIFILIATPITILLLLNFAYDYFVWVMLVLYGYSVASSLVHYIHRIYMRIVKAKLVAGPLPWPATTVEFDLGKCCGKISFAYIEFIAYPFCLGVAVFWFVFRNSHWAFILTNLLNVILVMRVIESLAFAVRIKIATILLVCFLVYDVFFVFITPLFSGDSRPQPTPTPSTSPTPAPSGTLSRIRRDTVMDYYIDRQSSVMERVALGTAGMSGEIIPIVFKVMSYPPAESITTCLLPYSILGLGDVILPAILLSLNLFFDLAWSNRLWPYFTSALVGYLLGLGCCAAVLFTTGRGQPALLYIVPLILIASYICAAIRREVKLYFYTALPNEYRVDFVAVDPIAGGEEEEAPIADNGNRLSGGSSLLNIAKNGSLSTKKSQEDFGAA